jgi:hypothetical protein
VLSGHLGHGSLFQRTPADNTIGLLDPYFDFSQLSEFLSDFSNFDQDPNPSDNLNADLDPTFNFDLDQTFYDSCGSGSGLTFDADPDHNFEADLDLTRNTV